MIGSNTDPMIDIAEAISNLFGHIGFAFMEDRHVEDLADALRDFFTTEAIPIHEQRAAAYYGSLQDREDVQAAAQLGGERRLLGARTGGDPGGQGAPS